ncbi:SGNH/GDSL hydrolase family protein [Pedobacter punctiformis]|uniref:SGNH/GDSL hydrolase family protein n=1 Tax=Pedobacter punctiformis TaxID=3004097 RepID=A0ABT4L6A0_9SPHI|nr:SGNH/GDSL hydrolase family protein [Pedobacter sp. HCMS5-2]MCZ4243451.1 SGNH/GDSL hydrolase family protein [Pedobacter sp. HCMS5-2]
MKVLFCSILFSLLTSACTKQINMPAYQSPEMLSDSKSYTYLALGDSYTIGEQVKQEESFPYQLQNLLSAEKFNVANPEIIATTGWTTDELQNAIKQANLTGKYDFVTLLIGVNNQYRSYPVETYKKEFSELLQKAITFANGDKNKVFVVSIPDWGATPFAKDGPRSAQTIAQEIDQFNAVNQQITLAAGVSYTDITPASRNAATDLSLVATDGLHPSGKMYSAWAAALLPKVVAALKQ